jgi:hypothetical protein
MPGMDRPKQRQVVVAVPREYRLALLGQRFDAALFHQQLPDPAAKRSVVLLVLSGFEHFAKDTDQDFLDTTMLIVESVQLLLGRGLRSPDQQAATFPLAQRSRRCSGAMKWNFVAQPLRTASPSSHVTPNATTTGCPSDISIGDAGDISIGDLQTHVGRPLGCDGKSADEQMADATPWGPASAVLLNRARRRPARLPVNRMTQFTAAI